jgi:hypothetical protein
MIANGFNFFGCFFVKKIQNTVNFLLASLKSITNSENNFS